MKELNLISCSLVIPLYQEGTHLINTIFEIVAVIEKIGITYEIILVDDGSSDNTWLIIQKLCLSHPSVRGLRLSRNFGKEAALAAGLEHAKGEAVIVMDGDLQHPPSLIPEMLQLWRGGVEIVEAVKEHRGQESIVSRTRAKLFYSIISNLTGFDLHSASDFKLMDRRVLEAWHRMGERNLFFRGMNAWLGFRREQILFKVENRTSGNSNWSLLQLIRLAVIAITSFSSAPLYLLVLAGFGFALLAFVLGLETIYIKVSGQAVDGFTTVILLLLILGCSVMLGLGLIGIYIARIYEEVKGRPRYIIAEIS